MALRAKRIRCTLRDLRVFVVKLACGLYEARDRWVCLVCPQAYSSTIVDRNPDVSRGHPDSTPTIARLGLFIPVDLSPR